MIPDLAEIDFMPRNATPTLTECCARLDQGDLSLKTAAGLAALGAACQAQL